MRRTLRESCSVPYRSDCEEVADRGGALAPAVGCASGSEQLPPADGTAHDLVAVVREIRAFTLENPQIFEVMYNRIFEASTPDRRRPGTR